MTIAPHSPGKALGTSTEATATDAEAHHDRIVTGPWYRRIRYVAPLVAIAMAVAVVLALSVRGSETTSPRSGTGNTTTALTPYDKAFGSFEPVTASGHGRGTIPLPPGARIGVITATHQGSGFFDVGFRRGMSAFPLISWVGVDGPYHGSVTFGLFDRPQADSLTVWAEDPSSWQVTIAPLSSAEELPTTVSSTEDAVFRYSGERTRWVFRKRGANRLLVVQAAPDKAGRWAWTTIVDGSWETLTLGGHGPSVVAVHADGGWSATVK